MESEAVIVIGRHTLSSCAVICLSVMLTKASADAEPISPPILDELIIDYEVGAVFIPKNTGLYGVNGTRFTATDTNQRDNLLVGQRISLEGKRGNHRLILLYAPFDVTTRMKLDEPLRFRDTEFAAGTVLDHRYLFDGLRGSYLYHLGRGWLGGRLDLELGGSVQVRNANVSFTAVDGSDYDEQTDIGFVPAFKARIVYTSKSGLFAMLDADGSSTFGLVGDVDGYLYDTALTLGVPILDKADFLLRARALGGGATVPDQAIDNRAHFLSLTIGIRVDLTLL